MVRYTHRLHCMWFNHFFFAFITGDKREEKPAVVVQKTPKVIQVKDTIEVSDFYVDSLFEEECPYVEGTVRAEAWHRITKR